MDLWQRRLVQADPKAAGAMALLNKGRGGFEVDEKIVPTIEQVTTAKKTPAKSTKKPATKKAVAKKSPKKAAGKK